MYFNRYDVCEAYYLYAVNHNRGQSSKEYALHSVFGRIGFSPKLSLDESNLTENGRAIYLNLVDGTVNIRDRCA